MEMTKYINFPVDLSNGLVKISIPLYEIVDGDIKIPISLNYHASGLKPNMRSNGWLENGWSLNTGPSLSRNIAGGADEMFYFYDMIANQQPTYQQLNLVANQEKDIALDEFYYSLLNHHGRFYFKRLASNQLQPVTIPVEPIKVSLPVANNHTNFINITDSKGLQYFFGGSEEKYKDFVLSQYGLSRPSVPTSWKVNKIYSPTSNRTISFDYYNNIPQIPYLRETDAVIMIDDITCQCTNEIPIIRILDSVLPGRYYTCTLNGQLVLRDFDDLRIPSGYRFPMRNTEASYQRNSYIKTIRFSGGRVEFTKNENNRKGLTSIRVYDNNNVLVKQIEFFQTLTYDDFPLLFLNQVKISSPAETESEVYSFQYNDRTVNKNPRSLDRWGYYNAANNTTLVPTINTQVNVHNFPNGSMYASVTIPGGNREPNETAMKDGILTGIIYPTGGRTNFIYEAHRYKDSSGSVKLAGGLRIKQIQNVNESGSTTYRNFKYSTSSTLTDGAGILNIIPTGGPYPPDPNFIYYSEVQYYSFEGYIPTAIPFKERTWSDNSIVNLFSEYGSSVSYQYITETASSNSSGDLNTGEQKHSFDVGSSYPLKYGNTYIVSDSKDGWTKGNKLSETNTKKAGNYNFEPVSSTDFSYNLEYGYGDAGNKITQWYVFKSKKVCGIDENVVSDQYKKIDHIWKDLSTGRKLLANQNENTINANGTVLQTTGYSYDAYGNITQTTRNTSRSADEKEITTILYAKDMVDAGRDPAGTYAAMVGNNMVGIPIEVKNYKNSVSASNLLTTVTTHYAKFNNKFYAPSEMISKVKNNANVRKLLFTRYDNRGNILEQQNIDDAKEVYLWGYWGRYPVAKVLGSNWSTVSTKLDTTYLYSGVETQIKQQLTNLRNAFADNPNVHVFTYLYKPLTGMISETDPSDRTLYYEYDGFGRLKRIYIKENTTERTLQTFQYHYKQ
jgi:YD repeat-containing protein